MRKRPGGALAGRPLHFIWIADKSGSMGVDGKIQALNHAIREAIPHMKEAANENPNAEVLVRAVVFSDGAQWHISKPTPIADFKWKDLTAGGITDMGKAVNLIADQLKIPPMTDRALPPVLVLISDGQPTDDFNASLKNLLSLPWGKKAIRIAIAIGEDADLDTLQKFIGNVEIGPFQANNPETLKNYIKWTSTAVLKATSSPMSQIDSSPDSGIPSISSIPEPSISTDCSTDIW
jgi:uncharacterized protein YegL